MEHTPDAHHAPDQLPFPPLESSEMKGNNSTFYESPDHPDLLVRQSYAIPVGDARYEKSDLSGFKAIAEGKKALDDLALRGVHIVPTLHVIGRGEPGNDHSGDAMGKPMLYGISQKITGTALHEIPTLDAETVAKADETFIHTLGQAWDAYQHGGQFWDDFKISQFMYGTIPGSSEKEVYLVDTEPHSRAWPDEEVEQGAFNKRQVRLFMFLSYVMDEINELEAKSQGNKCSKTRALITTIVRDMDTTPGRAAAMRDELIEHLDDERDIPVSPYDDVQ